LLLALAFSIYNKQISRRRRGSRGRRGRRGRRRRRRTSHLDDPLVLIMTPFFIILDRLTEPCGSFLDHRENADAQAASTDGRETLYANGQAHMFERKSCNQKTTGGV
jgi:hypothetical protein